MLNPSRIPCLLGRITGLVLGSLPVRSQLRWPLWKQMLIVQVTGVVGCWPGSAVPYRPRKERNRVESVVGTPVPTKVVEGASCANTEPNRLQVDPHGIPFAPLPDVSPSTGPSAAPMDSGPIHSTRSLDGVILQQLQIHTSTAVRYFSFSRRKRFMGCLRGARISTFYIRVPEGNSFPSQHHGKVEVEVEVGMGTIPNGNHH